MFRTCVSLLLMLVMMTGCHKKNKTPDMKREFLRINIHAEPPTLDLRKATDTSSITVISMCFEGLMKRKKNGDIQPAIAHKVEVSKEGLVYLFKLRPSKWWDGKPVTARDFERTWKTILSPDFLSGFANELYVLKNGRKAKNGEVSIDQVGVQAIDDYTLRVELEQPVPYFLELVSTHSFWPVPTHIASIFPNWASHGGHLFVGNGPYKLVKWKHHNCMELVKNPLYWNDDIVKLNELHVSIVEDENTELNMFESGDLDWAGSPLSTLPTDAIQALAKEKRLNTYPLAGTYYYVFNTQEPPFDNLNFRKAFSLAIHRQSIIDNIAQSQQSPATSLIPPSIWKVKDRFPDNDVEEARRLFDLALYEMGIKASELPVITLIYNTMSTHHKIAQAIQEQWFQAFGIRVKLVNKEWKVFLDELAHRQFQVARMGGVASFSDPITFLDLYKYPESPSNYCGWANPRFTQLIDKAQVTADLRVREQLLREAEDLFMSQHPIAPIYYYTGTYVKQDYVKSVEVTELSDADFKFAFFEM